MTSQAMVDEDTIEDAVYSLWQLALAMASIKHLYKTGHIMDKIDIDDLVTDVDTEEVSVNDGLENMEESDTEESIFITELLQHDNDTQTNSDHPPMPAFKTRDGVSTVVSKDFDELSFYTQRQYISSTLPLSDHQSEVVGGFNITESQDIFEKAGGQDEINTDATDSVTKEKVDSEEHLETENEDEKWFSSMVAHLVTVADIPMEYPDIPPSMVSHMIIKDQEWLTEECNDISMQSHQVFGIDHEKGQNHEDLMTTNEYIISNEVENERTEEINQHDGDITLQFIPDEKDINEGDRSNSNLTLPPHQISSITENDHLGTTSYSPLVTYQDIDRTDDKIEKRMESKDIIEGKGEEQNNQNYKSEPSKIQLDISNKTSSEANGFHKGIQEGRHEGEMNKIVKKETERLQMISEDNIDITEAQIMTNVKGVEFKSCIVLHQYCEDTGVNTTETIKDCKNYGNKTKSQPIDNVKVENRDERNMIDQASEEKELIKNTKDHKIEMLEDNKLSKKKERTLKKSAKTTFNVESKKVSYKIRFKVKLGEDSSKPSTLKYLFDLLGGDSLS